MSAPPPPPSSSPPRTALSIVSGNAAVRPTTTPDTTTKLGEKTTTATKIRARPDPPGASFCEEREGQQWHVQSLPTTWEEEAEMTAPPVLVVVEANDGRSRPRDDDLAGGRPTLEALEATTAVLPPPPAEEGAQTKDVASVEGAPAVSPLPAGGTGVNRVKEDSEEARARGAGTMKAIPLPAASSSAGANPSTTSEGRPMTSVLSEVHDKKDEEEEAATTTTSATATTTATIVDPEAKLDALDASLKYVMAELRDVKAALTAELKGAKAELKGVKAGLKGAKDELKYAKDQFILAKAELKGAKEELKNAKDELKGAKGDLKGAKEELKRAKAQLAEPRDNEMRVADELKREIMAYIRPLLASHRADLRLTLSQRDADIDRRFAALHEPDMDIGVVLRLDSLVNSQRAIGGGARFDAAVASNRNAHPVTGGSRRDARGNHEEAQ